MLSTTLMRDKYLLYTINEIASMIDPLRDLVYTYEYREIIVSIWMIILDEETWQFIMPSIFLF
jgi:hypothetical protein